MLLNSPNTNTHQIKSFFSNQRPKIKVGQTIVNWSEDLSLQTETLRYLPYGVAIFDEQTHQLTYRNSIFANLETNIGVVPNPQLKDYVTPYLIDEVLSLGKKDCFLVRSNRTDKSNQGQQVTVYNLSATHGIWQGQKVIITIFKSLAANCLGEFISDRSYLSSLVNNLPAMVYKCNYDRDLTMLYLSDYCQQLTGYRNDQLLNTKSSFTYNHLINAADRDFVRQQIKISLDNHREFDLEYRIHHASGAIK